MQVMLLNNGTLNFYWLRFGFTFKDTTGGLGITLHCLQTKSKNKQRRSKEENIRENVAYKRIKILFSCNCWSFGFIISNLCLWNMSSRKIETTQGFKNPTIIVLKMLLLYLDKSALSVLSHQLDRCLFFLVLQAQSTSCKKRHTCSNDRGKGQSGRDSWERTGFIIKSQKTQSEEESPARILSVCTSHPHTQTCRYTNTAVFQSDSAFCLLTSSGMCVCLWT